MTDKEQNKKTPSTSETDKDKNKQAATDQDGSSASQQKLSAAEATKIAAQAKLSSKATSSKSQSASPKSAPAKPTPNVTKKPMTTEKQGVSKTALLALFIALGAGAGGAVHYVLQQQENDTIEQRVSQTTLDRISGIEAKVAKEISQAQLQYKSQLAQITAQLSQQNEQFSQQSKNDIEQLQNALTDVLAQQPNNAQVTEAEYLVRMAGRVLWLEKNVSTAISLMQDADARLKGVNDPRLLSIRQLLHQDMEQLKLLPQLMTDEIILSFMGLSKQIGQLPLASLQLPDATTRPVDTELTGDINDWRENLAKTWHSFKEEFITVRRRTGQVEALMEPQFQRNLYHNLELKIQQIQWAASQKNSNLYSQSISDLQLWLAEHFDMTVEASQQFNSRLNELKVMPVDVEYPQSLASQQALQKLLEQSKQGNSILNDMPATPTENVVPNEQLPVASPEEDQQNTSENSAEKIL